MADRQVSFLEQVRSGGNRQLQRLAAAGLLPLPPEELIPLQVELAVGGDDELAAAAAEALAALDPRIAAGFLAEAADAESLAWFAATTTDGQLIEALLRRRDVPRELLAGLAQRVPGDLQELLLLRQDAILELPAILDALEENPALTPYARRRIAEYREHLLPRGTVPAAEAAEEMEGEGAGEEGPGAEDGLEEVTRTAFGISMELEIRSLSVQERVRRARGATHTVRGILIRDPNPMVALAVLEYNSLSEQEIERIATNRGIAVEVLEEICRHREWTGRYPIMKALVQNPRTPVPMALRMVGRLNVRDLRDVSRNRNAQGPVRSMAARLYRMRQH